MSVMLKRLQALAEKRGDLRVIELPGLDNEGYFVAKDGDYFIFIDRALRGYKKTAVLAHELGHYARRRIDTFFVVQDCAKQREREDMADRCSRRLLMFVRKGLWG